MPSTHATALFVHSSQRQDSTVAAKNFMSLFNPAASGKIITVGAFYVSQAATVAGTTYPMRGYRISTEPTGGTAVTDSEICRFDTQRFTPAALIRTGNPTVGTLGAAIFNVPSEIVKDKITSVEQVDAPFGFNPFILYPGEGVVMRQDVGAVGILWNLSIVWRELKG
jgi:hypothetical protein